MLPKETWLDVVRCLNRFTLDDCQISSHLLRQIIASNEEILPLREFRSAMIKRQHRHVESHEKLDDGCYYEARLVPTGEAAYMEFRCFGRQRLFVATKLFGRLRNSVVVGDFAFFGVRFTDAFVRRMAASYGSCDIVGSLRLEGFDLHTFNKTVCQSFRRVAAISTDGLAPPMDVCRELGLKCVADALLSSTIVLYCFDEFSEYYPKRRLGPERNLDVHKVFNDDDILRPLIMAHKEASDNIIVDLRIAVIDPFPSFDSYEEHLKEEGEYRFRNSSGSSLVVRPTGEGLVISRNHDGPC